MVSEIIVTGLILLSCISILIVSYGNQQEKIRKRNKRWMKEQLKNDERE